MQSTSTGQRRSAGTVSHNDYAVELHDASGNPTHRIYIQHNSSSGRKFQSAGIPLFSFL